MRGVRLCGPYQLIDTGTDNDNTSQSAVEFSRETSAMITSCLALSGGVPGRSRDFSSQWANNEKRIELMIDGNTRACTVWK